MSKEVEWNREKEKAGVEYYERIPSLLARAGD